MLQALLRPRSVPQGTADDHVGTHQRVVAAKTPPR